jgi:hypothetical protein
MGVEKQESRWGGCFVAVCERAKDVFGEPLDVLLHAAHVGDDV